MVPRNFSRVLIGPVEVAGVAQGLQKGLAHLNISADLVLECQHPFDYAAQEPASLLVRGWKWAGTQARKIPMWLLPLKGLAYAWHLVLCWPVLFWALLRYDAFVFLAGKTLTNTSFELLLMRMLRKPVIVIFLGSDSRPPYINGAWSMSTVAAMRRATLRQKRKVRRIERQATACVNAPGTSHFHERPVINWFALGLPRDVSAMTRVAVDIRELSAPSLRIVHSPSNSAVKGTALIQAAVERLQQRGVQIELVTLTGLSNETVLTALQRCDLVIDQMYSDTPMAGFAAEAALLGKPTLVGGYFARDMPSALMGMPVPPTRFVAPDLFEQALDELVCSAAARAELADAARHFVQSEWSCQEVAGRLLRIIRGEVPENWWYDPTDVNYLAGCGLSESAARERVRQLINHAGIGALQVMDKPALERAFANWAKVQPEVSTTDDWVVP
jgi:hypothetical protein